MPSSSSPEPPRQGDRIAKLLARAGIASRREIERMIADGRIAIDGEILTTPATVLTSLRGVTVDGNPVAAPAPARLFRFHKPAGVLTAERDPRGRPTIYDRLPKGLPRLIPVGRLDYNTEGLLLLTTDGELKRQLELPATGVERSYRARAFGQVSQDQLEELMLGVEIDGVRYGPIDANLERRTGANVWIELTLTEGKNREVRRVLEHLGLEVSRLIRTRYGPFHLADMPVAAVDEVRQHDLILFRKALSGPGGGKAASNLQLSNRAKALAPPPEPEGEPAEAPPPANRADRRRAAAAEPPAPPARERAAPRPPAKGAAEKRTAAKAPEKFGVGQRRKLRGAAAKAAAGGPGTSAHPSTGARKRSAPAGPAPKGRAGRPGPDAKPQRRDDTRAPAADRDHDDGGPLLDRPKRRYRPGDRRPRSGTPAKRGPRK
ncbi:pseudouridine synthase [Sphingomonas sp.]|uniref:pseudouridine synthase n=1 Tax=Sphingomonas sp. TaxID=28214 RepID=UPI001ED70182|nr:pseudouridine synthase [Sphingomonas sp.]MBX3593792.1 rRNA pseudouridine synthase [Sphingomonas sp.]